VHLALVVDAAAVPPKKTGAVHQPGKIRLTLQQKLHPLHQAELLPVFGEQALDGGDVGCQSK